MNPQANELAALTQALRKTLARRQHLGLRRARPGPLAPALSQNETQAAPQPAAPAPERPPGKQTSTSAQPTSAAAAAAAAAATPLNPLTSQTTRAAACPDLEQLAAAAAQCQACPLHKNRDQPVFSDGQPGPGGILFLGQAPGPEDNLSGRPFSGPPGQLLTDIIVKGMGLDRQQVTITTLVKCPTPAGRAPSAAEIQLCAPFLERHLELASPRVLVALGADPANFLLGTRAPLAELRGQNFERGGRQVIATFHPSQLLLEPTKKRDCWTDIQRAMQAAGLKK